MPTGDRFCSKCETSKPVDQFRAVKSDKITTRKLTCNVCKDRANVQWRKAKEAENPELAKLRKAAANAKYKLTHEQRRDYWYRNKYNITLVQYNEMLEKQKGVCALCEQPEKGKSLAVDHNHKCCPGVKSCGNCIRGLLCQRCNTAIAILDRVSHYRAINYVRTHDVKLGILRGLEKIGFIE